MSPLEPKRHAAEGRVVLARKQARALSTLLGQYQDVLENAIENELIRYTSGKLVDPKDPAIRARLQRDRRRWKACEGFQKILQEQP